MNVKNDEPKFDWKKNIKETLVGFTKELLSFACILIAFLIVISTQTTKQLEVVFLLINDNDWVILSLILFGIIAFGFVIESILKGIFVLFGIIKIIKEKKYGSD